MRTAATAIAALLFFTLLTGVLYVGAVTGIARLAFPRQAGGSLVASGAGVVGSELIAQDFKDPGHFWPRPSAGGFDPLRSGASNYAPSSAELAGKISERRKLGMTREMLFASGSGLDPHISPGAALDQVERIAAARGLDEAGKGALRRLVEARTEGRQFGLLGEERVNVLLLNLALEKESRRE